MDKHCKVKSRRKLVNPVFHLQTKDEDDEHLTKDVIKNVRKTGHLTLSCRHLSSIPGKMFNMYDVSDENAMTYDFVQTSKEDDMWWNMKPLTHLDLSSNVLTRIPCQIGMFQDLLVLNLQDNNLTDLPAEMGNLTKLTKLCINRNKINQLPKEFYKLTELKHLSLNNNCLESLLKDISDLVMLEKLDLSNNMLLEIPSGIGFLIRLTEINFSNNKLEELPPDIVNLRSLLKLDISHNNIKYLPDMGELRKLQLFYAQHNDIEEIPSFLGCQQLEEIYFGNNFIKELPIEFCENTIHLKILELRDNQIEIIPNEISSLAHLIKLDFTNNSITELPKVIGLMPHLQSLKVEGNKLKQIRPDIIQTGTNRLLKHLRERLSDDDLKTLGIPPSGLHEKNIFPDRYTMRNGNILNLALKDLSHVPEECFVEAKEAKVATVDLCKNKFTEIPSGLGLIADYVTELYMSVNQLKELPEFIKDLRKLKFCDFSKNLLTTLPQSFSSMVSLRELILYNNRLVCIPECIYDMVGLEILLLNDNNITEIDVEGLQKLKRLATLNLSNNNIHHVPPELGNMTQLRYLYPFHIVARCLELKGNPFRQPRYAILDKGTETILSYLRDKIPS